MHRMIRMLEGENVKSRSERTKETVHQSKEHYATKYWIECINIFNADYCSSRVIDHHIIKVSKDS